MVIYQQLKDLLIVFIERIKKYITNFKNLREPYISSSNYIKKMSNYKSGPWCLIWDGLFWKFIKDNENFFRKQYRLAMLTRNLDKMSEEKLNNHLITADKF